MDRKFRKRFALATVFILMLQTIFPGIQGIVKAAEVTEISTVEEYGKINEDLSGDYKLVNDIDFGGGEPPTIENFKGTFDGQGYSLKNFEINKYGTGELEGIFHDVRDNPVFKNLVIEDVNVDLVDNSDETSPFQTRFGLFLTGFDDYYNDEVTFNNITFKNIEMVNDGVSSLTRIGLLSGHAEEEIDISDINVDGFTLKADEVTSNIEYAGAIYGEIYSDVEGLSGISVKNIDFDIKMDDDSLFVGAIAGNYSAEVSNAYAHGEIDVTNGSDDRVTGVGGLFGDARGGVSVENSYTEVDINADKNSLTYVGGLVGFAEWPETEAGGGGLDSFNSYVSGNMSGGYVGGLAGTTGGPFERYGELAYESELVGNLVASRVLDGSEGVDILSTVIHPISGEINVVSFEEYLKLDDNNNLPWPGYNYYENMHLEGISFPSKTPGTGNYYTSNAYSGEDLKMEETYGKNNWSLNSPWLIDEGESLPYQVFNGVAMKESSSGLSAPSIASPSNVVIDGEVTDVEVPLSWDAVEGATGYEVTRDGEVVYSGADASFTDTGLDSGTEYTYEVSALKDGSSSDITEKKVTTKLGDPVMNVFGDPTTSEIVVEWEEQTGVDEYELKRDGNVVYTGTDLKFNNTGLDADTSYNFELVAKKGDMISDVSTLEAVTAMEVPVKPSNVSVDSKTDTEVSLSWDSVDNATSYEVHRDDGKVFEGDSTTFTDSGLTENTSYAYSVYAKNKDGISNPETLAVTTDKGQPDVPLNLNSSDVKETEATLNWDSVTDAENYILKRDDSKVYEGMETSFIDTELEQDTSYNYEVIAVVGGEDSKPSSTTVKTLFDVPENPEGFKVNRVSSSYVTLEWSKVNNVDTYEVYRNGNVLVYSGETTTFKDDTVNPETEYTYTLVAKNEFGENPNKLDVTVKTPEEQPKVESTTPETTPYTVSFDYKVVPGAVEYKVNRNPEWTYTPNGDGTYDVSSVNTETGETKDFGTVEEKDGYLPFIESFDETPQNQDLNYEIVAFTGKGSDGEDVTTEPENVSVTLPDSGDNTDSDLSGLEVTEGSLSPSFDPNTNSYSVDVSEGTNSLKVIPTLSDENARVEVNGVPVSSGKESPLVVLGSDSKTVNIVVTAEDGTTKDTYTIGINKGTNDGSAGDSGSSDGYEEGYEDGYGDGSSDGYGDGYDNGSSDGYDEGYEDGFKEGSESGSEDGSGDGSGEGSEDGSGEVDEKEKDTCKVIVGGVHAQDVEVKKEMSESVSYVTLTENDYNLMERGIEDGVLEIDVECNPGAGRFVVNFDQYVMSNLTSDHPDLNIKVDSKSEDFDNRFYYEFNVQNAVDSSVIDNDFALDVAVDVRNVNKDVLTNAESHIYDISFVTRDDNKAKLIKEFDEFVKLGIVKVDSSGDIVPVRVTADSEFTYLPSVESSVVNEVKFNRAGNIMLVERTKEFDDVRRSFAKEEIEELASRNVIYGMTEDTFAPGEDLTRIQLISLLSRLVDREGTSLENNYTDVPSENYKYEDALSKGEKLGIVLNEKELKAYEKVTREEFSIMVHNFVENFEKEGTLYNGGKEAKDMSDYGKLNESSKEVFDKLFDWGVVKGNASNEINFEDNIRRDEATAMIHRAYELVGMVGNR